jgi:Holliday junction resolvase RusA-like endonuclease
MTIVIDGEPVAQGRPKFRRTGNFVQTYDPAKSANWKQFAKMIASMEMKGKTLLEGPLSLSVCVYRGIPASWSKKKQVQASMGALRPVTKPDLDNYVKAAKDALTGIVWKDDSQVVDYHSPFGKFYSEKPRIEINIEEAI